MYKSTLKYRNFFNFVGDLVVMLMNMTELKKAFTSNNGILKTSQLSAL